MNFFKKCPLLQITSFSRHVFKTITSANPTEIQNVSNSGAASLYRSRSLPPLPEKVPFNQEVSRRCLSPNPSVVKLSLDNPFSLKEFTLIKPCEQFVSVHRTTVESRSNSTLQRRSFITMTPRTIVVYKPPIRYRLYNSFKQLLYDKFKFFSKKRPKLKAAPNMKMKILPEHGDSTKTRLDVQPISVETQKRITPKIEEPKDCVTRKPFCPKPKFKPRRSQKRKMYACTHSNCRKATCIPFQNVKQDSVRIGACPSDKPLVTIQELSKQSNACSFPKLDPDQFTDPCNTDSCCALDPCSKADPCKSEPDPYSLDPCKSDPCPKPDPCVASSCSKPGPCKMKDPCQLISPCPRPDPCKKSVSRVDEPVITIKDLCAELKIRKPNPCKIDSCVVVCPGIKPDPCSTPDPRAVVDPCSHADSCKITKSRLETCPKPDPCKKDPCAVDTPCIKPDPCSKPDPCAVINPCSQADPCKITESRLETCPKPDPCKKDPCAVVTLCPKPDPCSKNPPTATTLPKSDLSLNAESCPKPNLDPCKVEEPCRPDPCKKIVCPKRKKKWKALGMEKPPCERPKQLKCKIKVKCNKVSSKTKPKCCPKFPFRCPATTCPKPDPCKPHPCLKIDPCPKSQTDQSKKSDSCPKPEPCMKSDSCKKSNPCKTTDPCPKPDPCKKSSSEPNREPSVQNESCPKSEACKKPDPCKKPNPCPKSESCIKCDPCEKLNPRKDTGSCCKLDTCKKSSSEPTEAPLVQNEAFPKPVSCKKADPCSKSEPLNTCNSCPKPDPCKKSDPCSKPDPCKKSNPCPKSKSCMKCDPCKNPDPCKVTNSCCKSSSGSTRVSRVQNEAFPQPISFKKDPRSKPEQLKTCKPCPKSDPCSKPKSFQTCNPYPKSASCKKADPCSKPQPLKTCGEKSTSKTKQQPENKFSISVVSQNDFESYGSFRDKLNTNLKNLGENTCFTEKEGNFKKSKSRTFFNIESELPCEDDRCEVCKTPTKCSKKSKSNPCDPCKPKNSDPCKPKPTDSNPCIPKTSNPCKPKPKDCDPCKPKPKDCDPCKPKPKVCDPCKPKSKDFDSCKPKPQSKGCDDDPCEGVNYPQVKPNPCFQKIAFKCPSKEKDPSKPKSSGCNIKKKDDLCDTTSKRRYSQLSVQKSSESIRESIILAFKPDLYNNSGTSDLNLLKIRPGYPMSGCNLIGGNLIIPTIKKDPGTKAEHKDPRIEIEHMDPFENRINKTDPTTNIVIKEDFSIKNVTLIARRNKKMDTGGCVEQPCPPTCNKKEPCAKEVRPELKQQEICKKRSREKKTVTSKGAKCKVKERCLPRKPVLDICPDRKKIPSAKEEQKACGPKCLCNKKGLDFEAKKDWCYRFCEQAFIHDTTPVKSDSCASCNKFRVWEDKNELVNKRIKCVAKKCSKKRHPPSKPRNCCKPLPKRPHPCTQCREPKRSQFSDSGPKAAEPVASSDKKCPKKPCRKMPCCVQTPCGKKRKKSLCKVERRVSFKYKIDPYVKAKREKSKLKKKKEKKVCPIPSRKIDHSLHTEWKAVPLTTDKTGKIKKHNSVDRSAVKSDKQEKVPKNFLEGTKGLARSICRVVCPSKSGKDGKDAASYFRNHKHYACEFNYLQERFMPGLDQFNKKGLSEGWIFLPRIHCSMTDLIEKEENIKKFQNVTRYKISYKCNTIPWKKR